MLSGMRLLPGSGTPTRTLTPGPTQVVDEWENLVTEFGVKSIHVEDDNFLADKHRVHAIYTALSIADSG